MPDWVLEHEQGLVLEALSRQRMTYMKITPGQISEYHKEKSAAEICPVCKHDSWTLPLFGQAIGPFEENDVMVVAVSHIQVMSAHLPWENASIGTIVLTCNNCGFIRQHSLTHLTQWMKSKGYVNE